MKEFSRVLFVTPVAFNKISGGGVTFSNLFKGWPKSALATVHNDPQPTSNEICNRYYVLRSTELDLVPPLNLLRRISKTESSFSITSKTDHSKTKKFVTALKSSVKRMIGDSFPERARLTPDLENWIAEFQPQIIYTILGSNGMMKLVEKIRVRFDLPLVVHFMDDWVSSYHRKGFFAILERRLMRQQVEHFIAVSQRCLGISQAMCDAYSIRYGRSFEAFQNTIDTQRFSRSKRIDTAPGSVADILYVGSIFSNAQLEALEDCCRAVAKLNSQNIAATLTIVTPYAHSAPHYERLCHHPAIKIKPPIDDDTRFFSRISSADLLILPVNFSEESIRFIRYSMPTKVPAYLVSGTPILAYGPATVAQIDYAQKEGWAAVVSERNLDLLVAEMDEVLHNLDLRKKLSRKALLTAVSNHDANEVRTGFQKLLNSSQR